MIYFFFAKNLTEIDHFLPLMYFLNSKKNIVILSLFNVNITKQDIQKKFSRELIQNIKIVNFFCDTNILIKFILDNSTSFSKLFRKKSLNVKLYFFAAIRFFLFGNLNLIKYFLTKNKLLNYFKNLHPKAIFIDNNFEITGYYEKITNVSKELKINLFELPHSLTLSKRPHKKKNKSTSNIQVFNSEYEIKQYLENENNFHIVKSGSFKYDKNWQKLLSSLFYKKRKKKLILYIMTDHKDKNKLAEFKFLKYMVNQKNYDFVICPPSRDYYNFFKKHKKFKLFESSINFEDSLIKISQQADYFFTTISGGVVDGIIRLKPVYFLKFLQNNNLNRSLIFDEFKCFLKFTDFQDLKLNLEEKNLIPKLGFSQKKEYISFLKKYIFFENLRNKIIKNFEIYVSKK